MKKFNELNLDLNDQGKVAQNDKNLSIVKDALDLKSKSLCLAKFTQVTLHLGSGMVHSCHHPTAHKIPLDEISKNPAALFNTSTLKTARKEMLNGVCPSECDYCWRIEDNNNTSDRHYKSSEDWAIKNYDNVVNSSGDEFFKPTYLEVSFGNACNLACSYCGPEFSSKWVDQLKANGPLRITDGNGKEQWAQGWQDLDNLTIPNRQHNPYIEAYWKWFPEIYPTLKHYRITGGEPLLNKNTIKSLDYIIDNPRDDLELSINSNLSVPDKLWDQFLDKIVDLEKSAKFKKITIYTSFESWGEKAEYSRYGLDFDLVKKRYIELLEKTSVRCVVMATYNMLAITSFQEVLAWILDLKQKYNFNHKRAAILENTGYDIRINDSNESVNGFRVGIDIPYLRHPQWLDAQYCTDDLLENYMIPCLEFMAANSSYSSFTNHLGFEPYEIDKFERIVSNRLYFNNKYKDRNENLVLKYRAKFYDFINELDKTRNTKFLESFPEMTDFYNECKSRNDEYK